MRTFKSANFFLLTALLLLLRNTQIDAQQPQGPTLQQTVDFLKDRLPEKTFLQKQFSGPYQVAVSTHQRVKFNSNGCLMQIYREKTSSTGTETGWVDGATDKKEAAIVGELVFLRSVKFHEWGLTGGIDWHQLYAVDLPTSSRDVDPKQEFIIVDDEDLARRLVNAFKGWAQSCGAKEEPY